MAGAGRGAQGFGEQRPETFFITFVLAASVDGLHRLEISWAAERVSRPDSTLSQLFYGGSRRGPIPGFMTVL